MRYNVLNHKLLVNAVDRERISHGYQPPGNDSLKDKAWGNKILQRLIQFNQVVQMKLFTTIAVVMSVLFCFFPDVSASSREVLLMGGANGKFNVYLIDDDFRKITSDILTIPNTYSEVFSDGTIFAVGDYSSDFAHEKIAQWNGDVFFIKQPQNMQAQMSGICIDRPGNKMFFSRRSNGIAQLCELDLQSRKVTVLTDDKSIISIGIPALSPDGKKVAFYFSEGNMRHRIARFDLESRRLLKGECAPMNIWPYGPHDNEMPLWNKNSDTIYFSGEENRKFQVYAATIASSRLVVKPIAEGGFPISSKDLLSMTTTNGDMLQILPQSTRLIRKTTPVGKYSDNKKFLAYILGIDFIVQNTSTNEEKILNSVGLQGPFFWWLSPRSDNK